MRIFVTGSRGLVGHNVVENLRCKHDILSPSHEELDLLDFNAVNKYLDNNNPDAIVHCAGIVGGIQANIREPVRFLVENLEIGKNVVLAASNSRVPILINLGSSCMYPRAAKNPLKEEDVLNGELEPTNEGYAIAKIAVQRLCSYVAKENNLLHYKTFLPCNLYGKWDKFGPANSHMIPAVIRKLHEAKLNGLESVDIWGSGQARREFMYAGDLAEFIGFALDNYDKIPELINVGLGFDYSIDEYYETIAKVVGYKGQFNHDLQKPEGMSRKLVDISRLENTGWKAKVSIENGVEMTYKYFLNQEGRL